MEGISLADEASQEGPAVSSRPESAFDDPTSPLSAVQTLHTITGCECIPTHCPNRGSVSTKDLVDQGVRATHIHHSLACTPFAPYRYAVRTS